jgi:uncharacterized protein (DUF58 family)
MSLKTAIEKVAKKFSGYLNKEIEQLSLLTQNEIDQVLSKVESLPNIRDELAITNAYKHGQVTSPLRGSGIDFIENRAYVAGDNPRWINWRASARANRLQTRVFSEEREPNLVLLVDRRSSMRFATRKQLKITQAARVGLLLAYYYLKHNRSVEVVFLENEIISTPVYFGLHQAQELIQQMVAPAPAVPGGRHQVSMQAGLQTVASRFENGNKMVLVSDFLDLDEDCRPALTRMSMQNRLAMVQVLDPAEKQGKLDGLCQLVGQKHETGISTSELESADVRQGFLEHLAKVGTLLQQYSHGSCLFLSTENDLFDSSKESEVAVNRLVQLV